VIGTVQADTFGYEDAKKAIAGAKKGGTPIRLLRPSKKAQQRFCGDDWTMYLLGWKTAMAEKKANDAVWDDTKSKPTPSSFAESMEKNRVRVAARTAKKVSRVDSPRIPAVRVQNNTPVPTRVQGDAPKTPNSGNTEYRRGMEEFSTSVTRHCAPSSDNAQDWADYMAGWNAAQAAYLEERSFPEIVRVQVAKSATIYDTTDNAAYHLQDTSVVLAERMSEEGYLEFDWEGARYSVWPEDGVSFLED